MLLRQQVYKRSEFGIFIRLPGPAFPQDSEQILRIAEQVFSQVGIEECGAQPFESTSIRSGILPVDLCRAPAKIGLAEKRNSNFCEGSICPFVLFCCLR